MNHRLNKTYIFAIICTAPLLTGCGNSAISKVKKSSLDIDPTYTIEQAFENRPVCDDSEWDSFSDDKGRTVVQHNCVLKDAESYFEEQADISAEKINKKYEYLIESLIFAKEFSQKREDYFRDLVTHGNNEKDAIMNATDFNYFENHPYLLRIADQDIPQDIHSSPKDWDAVKEFNRNLSLWEALYPKEPTKKWASLCDFNHTEVKYYALQQAMKSSRSAFHNHGSGGMSGIQESMGGFLSVTEKHLECLNMMKKVADKRIEELKVEKLQRIDLDRPNHAINNAVEVFQWIVPEDGLPAIIYAGIDLEKNDGTTINKKIKPHSALKVVIDGKVQNLNDYFDDI